jgi:hypothetical protein
LNRKYGIVAIIACAVIAGVLIFAYNNTVGTTNSAGKSQQLNASNPVPVNPSTSTTGRHFFAGVNETLTLKLHP